MQDKFFIKRYEQKNKVTERLELKKLLENNMHQIYGIEKAVERVTDLTNTIFKDKKIPVLPFTENKNNENAMLVSLDYGYGNIYENRITFSPENWNTVGDLLDNLNKKKLHKKLKKVDSDIFPELFGIFKKHLLSQTLLTSILRLLGGSGAHFLSQLFCESYATAYFKEPKEIPFIGVANDMGLKIISLLVTALCKNKETESGEADKFLQLLSDEKYIQKYHPTKSIFNDALIENKVEYFIEMFFTGLGLEKRKYRYYLDDRDWVKCIKMCAINLLVRKNRECLDRARKTVETPDIITWETDLFNRIAEKTTMNDKAYHMSLSQILENAQEIYNISLGQEILHVLEDKIIYCASIKKKGKNTPHHIRLINENFLVDLPSELPRICNLSKNLTGVKLPNAVGDADMNLAYNKKVHSGVSQNYYIYGKIHDAHIFDANAENNKFNINVPFAIEFFECLFSCQTVFIKLYNHYKEFGEFTPQMETDLETIAAFVGQLMEINFYEFSKQAPKHLKLVALEYIDTALNLKDVTKTSMNYNAYEISLKDYYSQFKDIKDKIHSKKIMFNEIFGQLYIMLHFEYFTFNWFSDSRGRKQLLSLLSPQNMSFVRCLISLHKPPTVLEYSNTLLDKHNLENSELERVIKQVTKQVNGVIVNKLTEYSKSSIKTNNIFDVVRHVSCGKGFLYYALLKDYYGLKHFGRHYVFCHHVGYDCRNSGLQVNTLALASGNLATFCYLVKNGKDAYSTLTAIAQIVCQKSIEYYENLDKRFTDEMLDNLEIPYFDEYFAPGKKSQVEEFLQEFKQKKSPKSSEQLVQEQAPKKEIVRDQKRKVLEMFAVLTKTSKEYPSVLEGLLHRSMFKVLIMTTPYNASIRGLKDQMEDKFKTNCLKNGLWLDHKSISQMRKTIPIIHKIFSSWFEKNLPEASLIKCGVMEFYKDCKENRNAPNILFSNPFFEFMMNPLQQIKKKTQISSARTFKKKRVILKFVKNKQDRYKLKNALTANFIQSIDAVLVSLFNRLVYNHNIQYPEDLYKFFTNHDCYYVSPIHAIRLKQDLRTCFRTLFNMDLLQAFKAYPEFYRFMKEFLGKRPGLSIEDLCASDDFVN